MTSTQPQHPIAGLDGLRALAALAVFGVHFNQTVRFDIDLGPFQLERLLANGEHGVALFFSLSGFLLSLPFWRALHTDRPLPSFRRYAWRRIARIVPAYYGALTLLILLSGMWRFPAAYSDIALHYSFLFNFAEFSIFSINAPFWTLAVEMQFYALLPLLFLLLARTPSAWRLWALLTIGIASYVIHYWLISGLTRTIEWPFASWLIWVRPYGAAVQHSLFGHLPHFLLGVMASGWLLARPDPTGKPLGNDVLFGCCALLVLVMLATPLGDTMQIPYGRYGLPLLPILLTMLIISAPRSRYARRWLEGPTLRSLGIISYGIYIYHLPCLTLVDRTMARYQWDAAERWLVFGVAGLGLSLVAATTSYWLLERPVLRWVRRR